MKLILSRKGFDSQYGCIPSPIMPNGDLISMPIPEKGAIDTFQSLKYREDTYEKILRDLGYKQEIWECHLDPDIYNPKNQIGWKAIFGQSDAAAGHLKNQKIQNNDIFLFFGTFREVILNEDGKYSYEKSSKEKHIIYGYLQVGEIVKEGFSKYHWHPHSSTLYDGKNNNIMFVASKNLLDTNLPGFGTFKFSDGLVLTKHGKPKSQWILPDVLKGKDITYHGKNNLKEDYLQSSYRGQEFVIDCDDNILEWIKKLVSKKD